MIKVEDAGIYWNYAEDGHSISEVIVCDINNISNRAKDSTSSAGADSEHWLEKDYHLENPIGQFLWMNINYDWVSLDVKKEALMQFMKIEGQDWAKEILLCLGVNLTNQH